MPTVTLTLNDAQAQRVTVAFGRYWNLKNDDETPRSATDAEVKEFLIRQLKSVVLRVEAGQAEARISVLPLGVA